MAPAHTTTHTARSGIAMALTSAFTFGTSGAMAKALSDTGWTAGAAVLVRTGGAAVVLGIAVAVTQRRWPVLSSASLRTLLAYGVVAVAGTQLAFFNAIRTLDVGVALLLEFTAPVLLVVWAALRSRRRPSSRTVTGALLTMIGLVLVLDLTGRGTVDPGGVAWGLLAAVCLAAFFVLSERQYDDLPPLVMAAGGTAIGAVVIALAGIAGVVPLVFATDDVTLAGTSMSWLFAAAWLVVVATSIGYLSGIGAVRRLRTRVASFVALTEVLFAVLVAWVLLAQSPGLPQIVGGIAIIGGIVVVRRAESRPQAVELEPALEPGRAG